MHIPWCKGNRDLKAYSQTPGWLLSLRFARDDRAQDLQSESCSQPLKPESWLKFWTRSHCHPILLCTQGEQHQEEERATQPRLILEVNGLQAPGAPSLKLCVLQMLANPCQESLFLHCFVSSGVRKPEPGILSPGLGQETTGNRRDSSMCQHCPLEPSRATRDPSGLEECLYLLCGNRSRRKELYLRCHSRLPLGRLWLLWA